MAEEISNSKFQGSKEKEKLLSGTPSSFSKGRQLDASISKRKSSLKRSNTSHHSAHSTSTYEEELRSMRTLSANLSSGRSSTRAWGLKKGQKKGGGEGSNFHHFSDDDEDDSDNDNNNDNDTEGSSSRISRITDKSNIDVAERVQRIYESLNSFNERFRNFDALTSSRLPVPGVQVPEEKSAPVNSSKTSGVFRSTVKVKNPSGKTTKAKTERVTSKTNTKKAEKKKMAMEARRDVTRVIPKIFGLDPMAVIADSSVDDDDDSLSASQFQSQSEPLSGSTDGFQNYSEKDRPHKKQQPTDRASDIVAVADNETLASDEDVPNLGPVMPLLSDKKFLHKLQQREGRITRDINDMKNHLDVINTNVEKALRKAQVDEDRRKGQIFTVLPKKPSTSISSRGTVKKPLGNMPNSREGPSKKLTEFLQATGGATGGWTHDDHSVFMRTYMKWKDRPVKMMDILTKQLPNKSSQDVMAHVSWYDQYDSLHKTNQAYIRQWRISKRHEQEMIYRMGSEGHKANLEASKRRQELLQATRQEEREKSRNRLNHWKQIATQKPTTSGSDEYRKRYVEELIQKNASLNTLNVRKRLEALTEPRHFINEDVSHSLRNFKSFSKNIRTAPPRPVSTRSSSGAFTDTNDDSKMDKREIRLGRVASMRIGPQIQNDESEVDEEHLPKIDDSFTLGKSNKLLLQFRSRDNKIIQARKEAIDNIKSRSKNSMANEDIKKRRDTRKMESPSTVMRETKGWAIRKEIRQTEREEAQNEKFLKSLPSAKRRMHPPPFVNHIPKLESRRKS